MLAHIQIVFLVPETDNLFAQLFKIELTENLFMNFWDFLILGFQ